MIIHSKQMIFIHIQKTGGTSIAHALDQNPRAPDKHFSAREQRAVCEHETWESYFKFSFVRNPWDRLVSWWSDISNNRQAYLDGKSLNNFHSFVLTRASTFEEFLLNCDEEIFDPDGSKWIYRNQIDYLTDESGTVMVDFVGRFERLAVDFALITQKTIGRPLSLPITNTSSHRHYSEYYSPELASTVAMRFERDLEAFGYVFGK